MGLVACDLVMCFSFLLSLVAFARVMGGVWFVSPLPEVRAWVSLVGLHVGPVCGVWFDVGSLLCSGCCLLLILCVCVWGGGGGGGGGGGFRHLSGFPWLLWGMSYWLGMLTFLLVFFSGLGLF